MPAEFYTGFLGADAVRFPGQDSVDMFLTNPNGMVRVRQRVLCIRQGMSYVFYEESTDGGVTYTIRNTLARRIVWSNEGLSQPVNANIAPVGFPPVSCLYYFQVLVLY